MPFPSFSDIDSLISIDKEDAIDLILSSIALEEKSLSELIDIEIEKIRSAADKICARHNAGEIISINRSVDKTLKNIIMMQMMLQFKLDRLHEIILLASPAAIDGTTGTLAASGGVTGVTTAAEKAAAASFIKMRSVFPYKKSICLGRMEAKGCVCNANDSYYRGAASVTFNSGRGPGFKAGYLYYRVKNGYNAETFKASPSGIKIEYAKRPNRIVLSGCGTIIKDTGTQIINDSGRFELTLWKKFRTKKFQMVIAADNKPVLNHDSGEVIAQRGYDNENSYFCHVRQP
jgi:hypothetical protein